MEKDKEFLNVNSTIGLKEGMGVSAIISVDLIVLKIQNYLLA